MLEYNVENEELEYNLKTTEGFGFEAPKTEVNKDYGKLDNLPSVNGTKLIGNLLTEELKLIYEKLLNLPKINGKEIKGELTTEDLGIKAGTDIELITEILPESIEEDLEENQVYNGNAIHDLARLFGMEMVIVYGMIPSILTEFDIEKSYEDNEVYNANAIHQLLELFVWEITQIQEGFEELRQGVSEIIEKEPLVVTATFTLATQRLTNISHYYDKIKKAYDNGQDIKLKVTIAESGNIATADISVLDVSKNSAFFYPIMRTNIGAGTEIYFFNVEIRENTGSLSSYVLQATSLGE